MSSNYCVFCDIVARKAPARIEYEDNDVLVFHNQLDWADVMLLAIPKQHLYQGELWTSDVMANVARAAVDAGARMCPNGFRLLSNFGPHAMQSQPHAHVHVVDARYLRAYPRAPGDVHFENDDVVVFQNAVHREPVTLLATPREPMSPAELWSSGPIAGVARVSAELGARYCDHGFRLMSDIGFGMGGASDQAGIHIIGGTFLGEYA